MTTNPFAPLYQLQNTGTAEEKYANLPDFPRIIDVELTNSCNFRCLMCPTGNLSQTRASGFMEYGTAFDLILECMNATKPALRFIGWGEPTLHPSLNNIITIASCAGLLTHINTNGSKMDWDMAVLLCNAGLSSIKFSFQGIDRQSYGEMRNTDSFDETMEAVDRVRRARLYCGRETPYIHVSTTTTYETPEQIEAFKAEVQPLCDGLSIGKTIFDFMDWRAARLRPAEKEMLQRLAEEETAQKRHPDPCPEVYDKLSIHWDGSVSVCCNDYDNKAVVGKFPEQSIAELWRAPLMEEYRKRLMAKEYSGPLCTNCYDYMGLTNG